MTQRERMKERYIVVRNGCQTKRLRNAITIKTREVKEKAKPPPSMITLLTDVGRAEGL